MAASEFIAGGGLVVAGVLIGRFMPARKRTPKIRKPKPIRPICGCTHHLSYHDPKTGECHGLMKGKAIEFNNWSSRDPVAWEQVPCTCRQYSGPEPLPEYFAPEIGAS